MTARLVQELAVDGVPVALACRVLGTSRSGLYEPLGRAPSARQVADQALSTTIAQIRRGSRATYGAPRVHAELRLGLGIARPDSRRMVPRSGRGRYLAAQLCCECGALGPRRFIRPV